MKVYINGKFYDENEASVSVFDHGLLYGDGIFEGIRLYEGCVFRLDAHLERLEDSAKAILLELPWSRQEISDAVLESCRMNNLKDGYIRVVVTRGKGSLGISPKTCKDPQLIIIADKIRLYPKEVYENGLKLITVPTRRNHAAALPPMIKSLNYLNNILAKIEAQHLGYDEAIMLNDQGFVAECTGDNIFMVKKGVIYTPTVQSDNLSGITRQAVWDIAQKLGIPFKEGVLTRYDFWIADEAFLTGTAAELVAVTEIDARQIGDGKPGPVTQKILEAYRGVVTKDGTML